MRWMAISALLFCAITGSSSSKPNHARDAGNHDSKPKGPPTVTFINNETPQKQIDLHDEKTPHWYTPLEDSERQLVIVGFITFFAIWYQAVQSARATKAMERSTGVTMDIERGRVVTYWENAIHLDLSPAGVADGTLSHHFNWCLGNTGKTEATLTGTWARFIPISNLSDLPQRPDFSGGKEIPYIGEPLEPRSGKPQTQWFSVSLDTDLSYDEMERKHRARECFLFAYGYTKYFDTFGRSHEYRFGILYESQSALSKYDRWVTAGPSEYNRST